MAVKHELNISIGPDGNIEIEVKGVKGADCLAITKELEEALGVVRTREHTSEYYQQKQSQQEQVKITEE